MCISMVPGLSVRCALQALHGNRMLSVEEVNERPGARNLTDPEVFGPIPT